jgi:predicted metalloprotease
MSLFHGQGEQLGDRAGSYLGVLAHEYGHHVQGMSGLLHAYAVARYEAGPTTERGLEISRRLELQATCYSGMFGAAAGGRGSVDQTMIDQLADDYRSRGDSEVRDHGSVPNHGAWGDQGLRLNRTFQCNTWLAPAESVA